MTSDTAGGTNDRSFLTRMGSLMTDDRSSLARMGSLMTNDRRSLMQMGSLMTQDRSFLMQMGDLMTQDRSALAHDRSVLADDRSSGHVAAQVLTATVVTSTPSSARLQLSVPSGVFDRLIGILGVRKLLVGLLPNTEPATDRLVRALRSGAIREDCWPRRQDNVKDATRWDRIGRDQGQARVVQNVICGPVEVSVQVQLLHPSTEGQAWETPTGQVTIPPSRNE